ncbi:MAG TPA: type II toxin-antitoxin system VapC family toxin [Streptosporangiaceae bacterium]|nr:type II toxin-antitoxin system VapC family toxin [Streptosporangiaceae bacterium]
MTAVVADAYVVDTGVFIRWFIDQQGYEHAREFQRQLVDSSVAGTTVDFARVEVAGVLRSKGLLAGRLTAEEFIAAVRVIDDLGVTVEAITVDRLEQAAELAAHNQLRMYDALFVQLAMEMDLPVLTSDLKLQHAAARLVRIEVLRGIGDPA